MHAALDLPSGAADDDGGKTSSCSVSSDKSNILSLEEVTTLIGRAAMRSCPLNPMPTNLLTQCLDELIPVLADVINTSLQSGYFAEKWKEALITPLLKKAGLEQTEEKLRVSTYSPVAAHAYADDFQVYLSFCPLSSANEKRKVHAMQGCVADIKS